MTTVHALNECAPLREGGERTLHLQACKDETFREALIADPKGLIQWLIPQCFPRGKMSKQMTDKWIEEDQSTHCIIVPALSDEFLVPEVPEEQELDLIANMGCRDQILKGLTDLCSGGDSQVFG
jgi:hypothetical protein